MGDIAKALIDIRGRLAVIQRTQVLAASVRGLLMARLDKLEGANGRAEAELEELEDLAGGPVAFLCPHCGKEIPLGRSLPNRPCEECTVPVSPCQPS